MGLVPVLQLIGGLALLVVGAELLVRGASRMAAVAGIAPLVVGLTVVAFGTSSPELAVSLRAALAGNADIALGNVVGSNVFNVLFILGLAALVAPLLVDRRVVRREVPVMIGVSLLLYALAADGRISRLEGLFFTAGLVVYTVTAIRMGKKESAGDGLGGAGVAAARPAGAPSVPVPANRSVPAVVVRSVVLVGAGLVLLVVGADQLVLAATRIASSFGVSDLIIGLTLVAAGTSLPELATSVVASLRGERDIAVGNVVGSNVFNILAVLGISASIAPSGIAVAPPAIVVDLPVMVAVAIACLPVAFTGYRIDRAEGVVFLVAYVGYVAYLILSASRSPWIPTINAAVVFLVVPLLAVTAAAMLVNERRRRTAAR